MSAMTYYGVAESTFERVDFVDLLNQPAPVGFVPSFDGRCVELDESFCIVRVPAKVTMLAGRSEIQKSRESAPGMLTIRDIVNRVSLVRGAGPFRSQ
jgi:hypothetical protein